MKRSEFDELLLSKLYEVQDILDKHKLPYVIIIDVELDLREDGMTVNQYVSYRDHGATLAPSTYGIMEYLEMLGRSEHVIGREQLKRQ